MSTRNISWEVKKASA